ncbi:MAG: rhomboid family intramembrane serine protease [Candidatus Gracilibacteria bacterium]|nr:rhomboid family intramembrane serine protease [Candidatus Gracilibacteria bacterium]
MQNKSFSNILIILSFIMTGVSFYVGDILAFGMNPFFLVQGLYVQLSIQFLLYQFLHAGILHLVSNSFFLYLFGNQVEILIGRGRFILFFLLNTVFVGISLLFFANGNTIGISGFAMAILAYIFLELRSQNNPEYRSAGVFLLINIAIGFTGNISLVGHLSGAIFGMLFYYLRNEMRVGFLR